MTRLFRAAGDPMPATPPKMPMPPPIGRPPRSWPRPAAAGGKP